MTIQFSDVVAAAGRLDGHSRITPVLESAVLNDIAGCRILAKAECLQHTGSFKYRGAYNRLSALNAAERAAGVVAFSSGNHAQGVSRAAKELGIDAIIVMPSDAPKVKVDGVLADGARICRYDRMTESREDIAAQIAQREGRVIVPSFDDPYIIAGQGTAGLELAKQCADMDVTLDALIICIGGGGLCAGISTAFKELSPSTQIFGAEPSAYNDHQMSLKSGQRKRLYNPPPTLCDALMTPMPGVLTWPINAKNLSGVFDVSDEECLMSLQLAKRHLDVTLEPGGSVALTAALGGKVKAFETVGVILSGGNVDPEIFSRAMAL